MQNTLAAIMVDTAWVPGYAQLPVPKARLCEETTKSDK